MHQHHSRLFRKSLIFVLALTALFGCGSSQPIHYKTTYYAEYKVIINLHTEESHDRVRVDSLSIMLTESTLDYRTPTSTVYEETLALKNHYESTIRKLTSMGGVAISTSDVFWNEPHPDLFLSVMLLPQTFDLTSPNGDGYQLMLHLNFNVTPSAEIKAYLKETLGIDTEITTHGLDLETFMANESFRFHPYLDEQYLAGKERQP